jgi:hypothetical protein
VKVGDALWAAGVPLCSSYGGTEFGTPVAIADKKDIADGDWGWMRFGDDIEVRWAPQGDDTYECQVLVRSIQHAYLEHYSQVPSVNRE